MRRRRRAVDSGGEACNRCLRFGRGGPGAGSGRRTSREQPRSGESAAISSGEPRDRDLFLPVRILITLAFITIVILTLAQIFFRFALDSPLIWSEELARLLTVWLTFIGAAVVSWDGRHLNVDVGFALLPAAGKAIVRVMNAALSVGLLVILVGPTLRLVEIENFSELGALEIPSGIVRLPVAVGAVLTVAAIVLRLAYRRRRRAAWDASYGKDAM
jgi:TRAP-type C4-dicarboxylate transport system permease small subunit